MFKSILSLFMSLVIFISSGISSLFSGNGELRIVVPENWEMDIGDSRTLECVFDDNVTNRVITWSVSDEKIATVDTFGRVTAEGLGQATITAKTGNLSDSVVLNVVATPTKLNIENTKKDYKKEAYDQVENLQKIVTRYPHGSEEIPYLVAVANDYSKYQKAKTADGAVWTITDYGVLRTYENAPTERDREQRFMGDRYFYSADTTDGKVLAIFPDGENGIWTVMQAGVTHIAMVEMSGDEKAIEMSDATQAYVERHGLTSDAYYQSATGTWRPSESDNDGLWTSMYGAGELLRYATLRDDPAATAEEIEEARKTAVRSAEAILMLHYISRRTGTTQSYVRYQENGKIPGLAPDRWLSANALIEGGDYSIVTTSDSPAKRFEKAYASMLFSGNNDALMNVGLNQIVSPESWASTRDSQNANVNYAKRIRLLEGFVARTYSLANEGNSVWGNIYWEMNDNNTATGVSTKPEGHEEYYLNNENLRGVTIDASGEIPERLWNNLVGEEYNISDVTYKGDTSADELIGHVFIFKLMYDVLGDEDPELRQLMVKAIDNLAQHLVDNSYMLVDGSGQPTTWSNFSRTLFNSSSSLAASPLHSMVVLSIFKTAAYITGYEKWENEYRMAALDPAYEYAKIVSQQSERLLATASNMVAEEVSPLLAIPLKLLSNSDLYTLITRLVINYSDEEMAMLGFYTLFQLEDDKKILSYYKDGIDDWWSSIRYSENPLWYYIYQLAYPNKNIKDAYGNNIMDTAAWSLSRHPVSTRKYRASNEKRDDIATIDLSVLDLGTKHEPSYSLTSKNQLPEISEDAEILNIVKFVLSASKLEWAVAAPDERALHKYNHNSYVLHEDDYEPTRMEASTTYTLPYWMARYHGMLNK